MDISTIFVIVENIFQSCLELVHFDQGELKIQSRNVAYLLPLVNAYRLSLLLANLSIRQGVNLSNSQFKRVANFMEITSKYQEIEKNSLSQAIFYKVLSIHRIQQTS